MSVAEICLDALWSKFWERGIVGVKQYVTHVKKRKVRKKINATSMHKNIIQFNYESNDGFVEYKLRTKVCTLFGFYDSSC